jgi:hypothetical protein
MCVDDTELPGEESEATMAYRAIVILLATAMLLAQKSTGERDAAPAIPPQTAQTSPAPQPNDELTQMRDDLAKMESLNMNMSTEIEFLHDQNLQILLRTNSQMWTILIRDLRRQVALEEQRRSSVPPATKR